MPKESFDEQQYLQTCEEKHPPKNALDQIIQGIGRWMEKLHQKNNPPEAKEGDLERQQGEGIKPKARDRGNSRG